MAHLGSRVAAYVDGQLTADAAADAQDHLETCETCRRAVRAQQLLKARMTTSSPAPAVPPGLLDHLADLDRVRASAARPTGWRPRAGRVLGSTRLKAVVVVTGAAAGVVACAWVAGAPASSRLAATSPPVTRFVADFGAPATPPNTGIVQAALVDRDASRSVPGDDAEAVDLLGTAVAGAADLVTRYDVRLGASASVDGVRATEVVASADGRRAAAWWVAPSTGRALRIVTYDADGTPRERSATREVVTTSGTRLSAHAMTSLTRSGWPCHERLARDLERVEGSLLDDTSGRGDRIVSLVYSDGASRVSLYEQSGSLDAEALRGFTATRLGGAAVWSRERSGEPTVVTWDEGGVVYTVVSDADRERLADVVAELPHAEPSGTLDRVQRGMARMTRWADPLGT